MFTCLSRVCLVVSIKIAPLSGRLGSMSLAEVVPPRLAAHGSFDPLARVPRACHGALAFNLLLVAWFCVTIVAPAIMLSGSYAPVSCAHALCAIACFFSVSCPPPTPVSWLCHNFGCATALIDKLVCMQGVYAAGWVLFCVGACVLVHSVGTILYKGVLCPPQSPPAHGPIDPAVGGEAVRIAVKKILAIYNPTSGVSTYCADTVAYPRTLFLAE